MKYIAFSLLAAGASALAAKVAVKTEPFTVRPVLQATLLPESVSPVSVEAKQWAVFSIAEIVPHGSAVKKDQVLVRFDDEDFKKKLRDAESAANAGKLTLANSEAEFASAEKNLPIQLEAARQKAAEAAEAWDYFQKIRREADITRANLSLKQSELRLDAEREELKQLEKMYKADDLTENTEEIIMKRQREAVKSAEISHELMKQSHKRQLEISIPRDAVLLEREATASAIALKEQEQNLPRAFALKKIALEDARVNARRTAENLARLRAERNQFVIKAPVDGTFYYGVIQDGRWLPGDPTKPLTTNSPVMPRKPFAMVIPAGTKLAMESFVDEATMRAIKADQAGFASLTGRADVSFPIKVTRVSPTPGTDSRYRVTLSGEYPADLPVAAGMTVSAQVVAYRNEQAITVPAKALSATNEGGWEVEVEEAEGKSRKVSVQRGMTSGDKVEIRSGLAEGAQVVVPGA